jgi:hypothetical protein
MGGSRLSGPSPSPSQARTRVQVRPAYDVARVARSPGPARLGAPAALFKRPYALASPPSRSRRSRPRNPKRAKLPRRRCLRASAAVILAAPPLLCLRKSPQKLHRGVRNVASWLFPSSPLSRARQLLAVVLRHPSPPAAISSHFRRLPSL